MHETALRSLIEQAKSLATWWGTTVYGDRTLRLKAEQTAELLDELSAALAAVPPQATDRREQLAALAHEQWTGWMTYLFSKCKLTDMGDAVIPKDSVRWWMRQMSTPYADLSEAEKDSDRKEADRVLAALAAVPPQDGQAWYARAVKARNALMDAVRQLRGGHSAHMDACDLAFAELDIVLGLAPYRTEAALAAVETPQAQDGAALIAAERVRQVSREGWTPQHDDTHARGEMVVSAVRYAIEDATVVSGDTRARLSWLWPWQSCDWKPKDPIRNLVRAGALIAAEIDRRLRQQVAPATPLSQEREP